MARMAEVLNSLAPGPGKEDLRGFEWHYLQRLIHPENSTIRHGAQARAVVITSYSIHYTKLYDTRKGLHEEDEGNHG